MIPNFDLNGVNQHELNFIPRTSAIQDIDIITPENKTYIGLKEDYHPATYNFKDDALGSDPVGWTEDNYGSNPGHDARSGIVSSFNGHDQVYCMTSGDYYYLRLFQQFSGGSREYGTVDCFFASEGGEIGSLILTRVDSPFHTQLALVFVQDGYFTARDGSDHDLMPCEINQWYHVSISWDRTTGGYMDLSKNKWNVVIDGNQFGEFDIRADYDPETFMLYCSGNPANPDDKDTYLDAVGYSWDPDYKLGDNLNGDLLLKYENSTNLEWTGYSLDDQANVTITGNTIVPMPDYGPHTIQVFGSDSSGSIHESQVRHFSISPINIITPENKTYTVPRSGYYPATFNFENDNIGTLPLKWTSDNDPSTHTYIVSEQDGHEKVLELYNNRLYGFPSCWTNFTPSSYGTIEFWWYIKSGYDENANFIHLRDSTNYHTAITMKLIINSPFWAYNGSTWGIYSGLDNMTENTWVHIRLDFRATGAPAYNGVSENSFIAYINGEKGPESQFRESGINDIGSFEIDGGWGT